jgi:hypothetical protein
MLPKGVERDAQREALLAQPQTLSSGPERTTVEPQGRRFDLRVCHGANRSQREPLRAADRGPNIARRRGLADVSGAALRGSAFGLVGLGVRRPPSATRRLAMNRG